MKYCAPVTRIVAKIPTTTIPEPMARPIPAVTQIQAAVVRPRTDAPFLKITPAPRKLMPLTTWAATRAGSAPRVPLKIAPSAEVRSANPYLETIIIMAAAQQTITMVRMPASLKRLLRSTPITAPHRHASIIRKQKSRFCMTENWPFKYSSSVILHILSLPQKTS